MLPQLASRRVLSDPHLDSCLLLNVGVFSTDRDTLQAKVQASAAARLTRMSMPILPLPSYRETGSAQLGRATGTTLALLLLKLLTAFCISAAAIAAI